jgi:hypothetical protein
MLVWGQDDSFGQAPFRQQDPMAWLKSWHGLAAHATEQLRLRTLASGVPLLVGRRMRGESLGAPVMLSWMISICREISAAADVAHVCHFSEGYEAIQHPRTYGHGCRRFPGHNDRFTASVE